ncbi:MAG: NYN domain-containing protein [Candidatus Saccharibacteria bacterium]|nr:NYN domain-containing protein [Candidatus Saccharibacteria bacterium]
MNRVVLIDGENLTYALRNYDKKSGGDGGRAFLSSFDYRKMLSILLEDMDFDDVFWFGARIKVSKEAMGLPEVRDKVEGHIKQQNRLVNQLKRQDIKFEKVGYLRDRQVEVGEVAGLRLTEKGVDVGLAVKIMELSIDHPDIEVVLLSSDTDLLPAIDSAKSRGVKFVFVGYDYMPIMSIQKRSHTTRLITPALFRECRGDLGKVIQDA